MSIRKVPFEEGEFYHIYNRGVDKRDIFLDEEDLNRFLQGVEEFNVVEPIGSIYENSFTKKQLGSKASKLKASKLKRGGKLVNFVCYCLNPNHYHFTIQQVADRGIEKFMQRIGTGYTKYFNNKYKRTGALFQGKFKAVHINSNPQLIHLSVYINLNHKVHQLGSKASKLVKNSWNEYIGKSDAVICSKDIILGQFKNIEEYKKFAEEALGGIIERRKIDKEDKDTIFIE